MGTPDACHLFGRGRGIQGSNNSCYLDTTLFSLFYTTTHFDSICTLSTTTTRTTTTATTRCTNELERNVRILLTNRIIRALRTGKHFCSSAQINTLRHYLAIVNTKVNGQMMDVDEFLGVLCGDILHLAEFIRYSVGTRNYLHQIMMIAGGSSDSGRGAGGRVRRRSHYNLQALLERSMDAQNLRLVDSPSPALIVKMPRSNGQLVQGVELIVPNLVLDLTPFHSNTQTASSLQSQLEMELLAVICVRHRHYTTYVQYTMTTGRLGTRSGTRGWLFFDSMAHFSEPEVTRVSELTEWLTSLTIDTLSNDISSQRLSQIPQHLLKVLRDVHICIYVPMGTIESRSVVRCGAERQGQQQQRTQLCPPENPSPATISAATIAAATGAHAHDGDLNFFTTVWRNLCGAVQDVKQLFTLSTEYQEPRPELWSNNYHSRFGLGKGIQACGNSSLFDAVFYALLHRPTAGVDATLSALQLRPYQQQPHYSRSQEAIHSELVMETLYDMSIFLRHAPYTCPAFKMNELRCRLALVHARIVEERLDIAELITILFQSVFKFRPFLNYQLGGGEFVHTLVVHEFGPFSPLRIGSFETQLVQLQSLFLESLRAQGVRFVSPPTPFLLIKLPSSSRRSAAWEHIVPNIKLLVPVNGQQHVFWLQALICRVKDVYVAYILPNARDCNSKFFHANSMHQLTDSSYQQKIGSKPLVGMVKEVGQLRERLELLTSTERRQSTIGNSERYVLNDCTLAMYTTFS